MPDSGLSRAAKSEQKTPKGVATYLHKPFNLLELLDTVHQRC
jgi:hypothetical protein